MLFCKEFFVVNEDITLNGAPPPSGNNFKDFVDSIDIDPSTILINIDEIDYSYLLQQ